MKPRALITLFPLVLSAQTQLLYLTPNGQAPVKPGQITVSVGKQTFPALNGKSCSLQFTSFALLLDVSSSVQTLLPSFRTVAEKLFGSLISAGATGYVGLFNYDSYISPKPLSDEEADHVFEHMPSPHGGTALRDAIVQACKILGISLVPSESTGEPSELLRTIALVSFLSQSKCTIYRCPYSSSSPFVASPRTAAFSNAAFSHSASSRAKLQC